MTGQLLAAALQHEKPELEVRKSELLKKEEEHKIQISRLEDFLLEQLASSSGNILENKDLLSSLNETKEKSASIAESLKESVQLQESLEQEGNAYLPLAEFASKMFFTIADLAKLNNMYRTSLAAFLNLYQKTLRESSGGGGGGGAGKRIDALMQNLQVRVFHYISRSLFKADRLTFGVHLVNGMYPKMFSANEYESFLGLLVEGGAGSGDSAPGWVQPERKAAVARLKASLRQVFDTAQIEDGGLWQNFASSEDAENEFPVQVAQKLTPFQQVR